MAELKSCIDKAKMSSEMVDPLTSIVHHLERIIILIKEIVPEKEENETGRKDGNLLAADEEILPENETGRKDGNLLASDEEILPDDQTVQGDGNPSVTDKKLLGKKLKLYRAALNGDWEVAEPIFADFEEGIRVKISRNGDTALHIAAAAKRVDFVKKLVRKMKEVNLAVLKNNNQWTALHFAATSGMVEVAKELMNNKNKDLAEKADKNCTLPIAMAARLGHKNMVRYLFEKTKEFLSKEDQRAAREDLFVRLIEIDLYVFKLHQDMVDTISFIPYMGYMDDVNNLFPDVALQMLEHHEDLAFARVRAGNGRKGATALHVLARKRPMFSNLANQHNIGVFKSCFNLGVRDVEKTKLELVGRIWERVILLSHHKIIKLISEPRNLIFEAADRGDHKFLSVLIREYPDLIYKVDKDNKYSLFHFAVKNRQEDVFNLIYEIGLNAKIFVGNKNKDGNNILHLAGMLAPSDRLNIVSGPALKMQREVLWFQEVKKVVEPRYVEDKNEKDLTPEALFTKEHEDLRDKGEKWMKDTAGSCMVVAALIATVAFAAAFTVPGGSNGDTGFPFFLEKVSFKIFAIADAISLVSSSTSIIYFLSILTSRYAEKDFLWSLPRKLRFGLVTLFISIAAMMTVFSTTYFIIFNDRRLWIAILVTAISSIPVIAFICQHCQLFWDVLRSKDSLFQQGKTSLFRKEGEVSDKNCLAKIFNNAWRCSTNV